MFWIFCLLFLCILSFCMGWTILGFILLSIFIIAGILFKFAGNEEKKKQEEIDKINEEWEKRKKMDIEAKTPIYSTARNNLIMKYGEPTRSIFLNKLNLDKEIIIFEQANRIWLCGKDLPMKDIISCNFSDTPTVVKGKITHNTQTNNENMIKRAVVGNILFGEAGAVVGGSTAAKTTKTTQESDKIYHHYTVIININSISDPIIKIEIDENKEIVDEIVGLINVIINRNN